MSIQPDAEALNARRVEIRLLEWMRAGRIVYKLHAKGVRSIDPADVITQAEETQ